MDRLPQHLGVRNPRVSKLHLRYSLWPWKGRVFQTQAIAHCALTNSIEAQPHGPYQTPRTPWFNVLICFLQETRCARKSDPLHSRKHNSTYRLRQLIAETSLQPRRAGSENSNRRNSKIVLLAKHFVVLKTRRILGNDATRCSC